MAEDAPEQSSKTEDPSQKKLEDAQKKGDVAKSQEVTTWFMLAGSALMFALMAGPTASALTQSLGGLLANAHQYEVGGSAFGAFRTRFTTQSRDRLGLGPTAARTTTLAISFRIALGGRFGATIGAVHVALRFLVGRTGRRLAARLVDGLGDCLGDQLDRPDRVVVTGDRHRDEIRIGVRVADGDDRDAELVGFGDRDALLLAVDDEEQARYTRHGLDAFQILGKLLTLTRHHQLFLLRVVGERAIFRAGLEVLELTDLLLDRLEVGEHAAQPALRDEHGVAALGFIAHDGRELALGADEEHTLAAQHDLADELLRQFDLAQRLLQVDDVNAIALGENEPAHLGIPAASLVSEVDASGQQLFE